MDAKQRMFGLILCILGTANVCAIANAERPKLALLIGVSEYANLSKGEQLDGCRNDVTAMRALLKERFAFEDGDITTLVDEQATGKNIRSAMRQLRDRVLQEQDSRPIVVFHFSGHGSQVLDQKQGDPRRDETDGLDETLVPYDALQQGGDQDIRDDELYELVDDVCANGKGKLWVVLDCCHSGTGARGVTKVRKLTRANVNPIDAIESSEVVTKRLPPGAVFLSACRAEEVEPEYDDGEKSYGLLTRFLVQVLNEEAAIRNMSYEQLRQAIVSRYRTDRSVSQAPMPTLEYGVVDSLQESVIDGVGLNRSPAWPIQRIPGKKSELILNAGSLHGVTVGSHFELYALPDQVVWEADSTVTRNGDSKGWLQVESVAGNSSVCSVFMWNEDQEIAPARLASTITQGTAVERYHDHGDAAIRVKVVKALAVGDDSKALGPSDSKLPKAIQAALEQKGAKPATNRVESKWIEWIVDDSPCDVLIRIDGEKAAMFPATGGGASHLANPPRPTQSSASPLTLRGGWGPIDLQAAEASVQIGSYLKRIVRARNLVAIAARHENGSESRRVKIRLDLLHVDEATDDGEITSSRVWKPNPEPGVTGERQMHDGDKFGFRVTNEQPDGKPVYVTVLKVNSDMEIEQIHPFQPQAGVVEGEQLLEPGESLVVPGYWVCNGDEDEPRVYGENWAVVLATREKNNFYLLAQSGLPKTRSARGRSSSLEDLLLEQTEFKTRGDRRKRPRNRYDDSWGAAALRWIVVPQSSKKVDLKAEGQLLRQLRIEKMSKKMTQASRYCTQNANQAVSGIYILREEHLPLDDQSLMLISGFTQLEALRLDGCGITDSQVAKIAKNHPQLKTLSLVGSRLTQRGIDALSKLTMLKTLNLFGTDLAGISLGGLPSDLQSLALPKGWCSEQIYGLAGVKGLQNLSFEEGAEDNIFDPFQMLTRDQKRSSEEAFQVLGCLSADCETIQVGGDDRIVPYINQLRGLRSIELDSNGYSESGLAKIQIAPELQRLSVNGEVGAEFLKTISKSRSVTSLTLTGCATNDSLMHVASMSQLTELTIFSGLVEDEGLSHLKLLKQLKQLEIQGKKTTAKRRIDLYKGVGMDARQILKMEGHRFIKGGNRKWWLMFKGSHYTKVHDQLALEVVGIGAVQHLGTSVSATEIQETLKLPDLQYLRFVDCEDFNDEALYQISKSANLTRLSIDGCKHLTNQGVEALSKLSSLKSLTLRNMPAIDDETVANLEKALPNCKITQD